jgi:hypothetical protein
MVNFEIAVDAQLKSSRACGKSERGPDQPPDKRSATETIRKRNEAFCSPRSGHRPPFLNELQATIRSASDYLGKVALLTRLRNRKTGSRKRGRPLGRFHWLLENVHPPPFPRFCTDRDSLVPLLTRKLLTFAAVILCQCSWARLERDLIHWFWPRRSNLTLMQFGCSTASVPN